MYSRKYSSPALLATFLFILFHCLKAMSASPPVATAQPLCASVDQSVRADCQSFFELFPDSDRYINTVAILTEDDLNDVAKVFSGRRVNDRTLLTEGTLLIVPTSFSELVLKEGVTLRVNDSAIYRMRKADDEYTRLIPDPRATSASEFTHRSEAMVNAKSSGLRNFHISGFRFANPSLNNLDNYLQISGANSGGIYLDNLHFDRAEADAVTQVTVRVVDNSLIKVSNVTLNCSKNDNERGHFCSVFFLL